MNKPWGIPTKKRAKAPKRAFVLRVSVEVKSKGKVEPGSSAAQGRTGLLVYRVAFKPRPEGVSHNAYEDCARKVAYEWFVYELGAEIIEFAAKYKGKVAIRVSHPMLESTIVCILEKE